MKSFLLFGIVMLFFLPGYSQDTTKIVRRIVRQGAIPLDTNRIVFDEQGNELHFYQYQKLLNTGEYTLRSTDIPGSGTNKYFLKKITSEQRNMMYQMLKTQMAIKNSPLQDGQELNIAPLLDAVNNNDLEGKVIVLIFWDPECPPCTESFQNLNDFLKQIHNPEDLIVLAITNSNELTAAVKLKQKPLLYARIVGNARSISQAYNIHSIPAYVLADKSHIIRFAVAGQSPVTVSAFKDAIRQVLLQ